MAILTQKKILNVIPGITPQLTVHCSQSDEGSTVEFELYAGSVPFEPDGTASVQGIRKDGTGFGPEAVTLDGSTATVTLSTAMTGAAGPALCEITITETGGSVSTANFALLVEEAAFPNGPLIENSVDVYQQILQYVQSFPASAAADATAKVAAEAALRQAADQALQAADANLQSQITVNAGAIAAETSARDAADDLLQTQIDEIIAPTGEAPSAAEVQNARIGADGTVYDTLGNAIRGQVTDLKSAVINTRFSLLSDIDFNGWTAGKYVYYVDGHVGNSESYSCSGLILLNANASYKITGATAFQYAIYDKNGAYRSGSNSMTEFIPDDEDFYFRFSCPTADLENLSITYSFETLLKEALGELFDTGTITFTDGYYRRYTDGGISVNADWCYSSFIPVLPNELVSCGWDRNHIAYFDSEFRYVSGVENYNIGRIPDGAVYMTVSLPIANKASVNIDRHVDKVNLSTLTYSDYKRAFADAQNYLLPIIVHGGVWDVSDLYTTIGLQLYGDLIGVGNPVFIASPSTYNVEFSIINLKATTKNKNIHVEGITFDATNMRYCVHDEMGGTTTDTDLKGYGHHYKNCTFLSRENVIRPVGIGVGDDGLITFDGCIFKSTASDHPVNLLDIHGGYQGQNKGTESIVKNCIFVDGTCSFTEYENFDYSASKNICIATNNHVNAEPYVVRSNNKQIDFYSWNNHVAS